MKVTIEGWSEQVRFDLTQKFPQVEEFNFNYTSKNEVQQIIISWKRGAEKETVLTFLKQKQYKIL